MMCTKRVRDLRVQDLKTLAVEDLFTSKPFHSNVEKVHVVCFNPNIEPFT